MFVIPGLGPILVAGPLVAWIVAGLEGAVEVGALGALGAGLFSIGIPKDSVVKYQTALTTDQFLLIAHGTAAEVAKDIIESTKLRKCRSSLNEARTMAADNQCRNQRDEEERETNSAGRADSSTLSESASAGRDMP